jgi:uncharacterized membrane protein YhaH (DUF805 family)
LQFILAKNTTGVAMEVILSPFLRYADFSGRSRRMEYWLFSLLNGLVLGFLAAGFVGSLLAHRGISGMGDSALNFLTLFVFWMVATVIPGLAVTVRRLHDINLSGWFYLIAFIPYLGGLILFVMMLIDGTKGPNNYGPDPKERGDYWWEGDGGPPEGYRPPARTTGKSSANHAKPAPASASGLRAGGFGKAGTPAADMDREEWMKRINLG